jgi:hypothetical protein
MQCENYQNNNQHCIKKIPQYQTQFLLVGQLVVNAAQYSINLIEKEFLFFSALLSDLRESQLLQKILSCSLLIFFLFWDSSIRQFVANTSILVKQLEGTIHL